MTEQDFLDRQFLLEQEEATLKAEAEAKFLEAMLPIDTAFDEATKIQQNLAKHFLKQRREPMDKAVKKIQEVASAKIDKLVKAYAKHQDRIQKKFYEHDKVKEAEAIREAAAAPLKTEFQDTVRTIAERIDAELQKNREALSQHQKETQNDTE